VKNWGCYFAAGIVGCAMLALGVWMSRDKSVVAPAANGPPPVDSKVRPSLLAGADDLVLAIGVDGIQSTATDAAATVIRTVAKARGAVRDPAGLTIDAPLDQSLFPQEIVAPTFLWHDPTSAADMWLIDISFGEDPGHIAVLVPGKPPPAGRIDPRCIAGTNEIYHGTLYQQSARSWTPGAELWSVIKRHAVAVPATIEISGFRSSRPGMVLSDGRISIATSSDPVGAPIFYRDVPLAPSKGKNGTIQPLSAEFITLIAWRLRDISKPDSRLVLTDVPTCTNCHSFSADGKTMGMDLDGPNGDKGTYVIAPVGKKMAIGKEDTFSWNRFADKPKGHKTIGFLSRVSPDGQTVVSTVNESLYVRNFEDYKFLQVFYPTRGILACYSRATGEMKSLPGADDPAYVHCDAVWTPDGRSLVFARAKARDPYPDDRPRANYAGDPNEVPIQYDLYRIPFNEGRGGKPEPIAGASRNGMSNTFPKVSPDGKWIVFVKCKNGQLMRPDSRLWIVPAAGGQAREMRCNTRTMNSWHSFSPNSRWLVFSSKVNTPYTQMFLTHIDERANDSPAILIPNSTASNRAVNLPEFVNIAYDDLVSIDVPALDYRRHNLRGIQLATEGRLDDALAEFDKAVENEPDYLDGRMNAALLLCGNGRAEEAKTRLEELLRRAPQYLPARRELARLLEKQGRVADAMAQYEIGLDHNPEFLEAHAKLARYYLDGNELEKATGHLQALLAADSKNPRRFLDLAMTLLKRGMVDEAARYLEKSLQVDPNFAAGHFYLGEAMTRRHKYASALAHFEKAMATDSGSSSSMTANRLAWLLATCPDSQVRDGARAVRLAEHACASGGYRDPDQLSTLAAAYAEIGRFDDALKWAANAARLADPRDHSLTERIRRQLKSYKSRQCYRIESQ